MAAIARYLAAAVFVVSGAAKLIDPGGVAPQSLSNLPLSYPALLRLLGAVELILAALLALRRTRLAGCAIAFGLLVAFTLFLAENADDMAFVNDCGCFGPLEWPASGDKLHGMLIRNALLGGLYLSERELRTGNAALVAAMNTGEMRTRVPGWRFPPVWLRTPAGEKRNASLVLRGGDHLIFFSANCLRCRLMAAAWPDFAKEVRARGGQLVLIAAGTPGSVETFRKNHGCSDLPLFVLRDRLDMYRLGVFAIPNLVVLDRGRRVVFHESQPAARSGRRIPALAKETWDRIAARLFGEGAVCAAPLRQKNMVWTADVNGPTGPAGRLVVARCAGRPAHTIEAAIGLDKQGRIKGMLALDASGYVRFVDPELESAAALRGLAVGEAIRRTQRESLKPTMRGPIWRSLGTLLLEAR